MDNIFLEKVGMSTKHILCNLFQLYMHDITKDLFIETNENGLFDYPSMDRYFSDGKYIPYFIKCENKIVGFVFVSNDFLFLENEENNYALSEMFILNGYKKRGIGRKVAKMIFDRYKGTWEVKPVPRSEGAKIFWEKIIQEYSNGNYQTFFPKPNRTTFIFDNRNNDIYHNNRN